MEKVNDSADKSIRVIGEYVLIKQVLIKKDTRIIMDASKDEKDKFDISFKVLELGNKCTSEIRVGDAPIFTEYVKFNLGRVIQKNKNGMISLLLVHENDIIGADEDPNFKMLG